MTGSGVIDRAAALAQVPSVREPLQLCPLVQRAGTFHNAIRASSPSFPRCDDSKARKGGNSPCPWQNLEDGPSLSCLRNLRHP